MAETVNMEECRELAKDIRDAAEKLACAILLGEGAGLVTTVELRVTEGRHGEPTTRIEITSISKRL